MGLNGLKSKQMRLWTLWVLVFGLSSPALGGLRWVLDFDGSLIGDYSLESPWKTAWILVRVDKLSSSVQLKTADLEKMPRSIQVSYAEWIQNKALWAKADGVLGSLTPLSLEKDPYLDRPKTIIPGYYRLEPSRSFRYYETDPETNHLLSDYEKAVDRMKRKGLGATEFFGTAMPLLQRAMSQPEQVGHVHIFTARTQTPGEFEELFRAWKEDGFLGHVTGLDQSGAKTFPRIHNLTGPQSIVYGSNLAQAKAGVVSSVARELAFSSEPKGEDYGGSPHQSSELIQTHTLIVAEDHPVYLKALSTHLLELSSETELGRIKYVLLNTSPAFIRENMTPPLNRANWLVFHRGFAREATPKEISRYIRASQGKASGVSPSEPSQQKSSQGKNQGRQGSVLGKAPLSSASSACGQSLTKIKNHQNRQKNQNNPKKRGSE